MSLRVLLLLVVSAWPVFGLSEQHVDENFSVSAGAKLIVDVDFGTIDLSRGPESSIAVNVSRKIDGPNETQEKEYLASAPLTIAKEGNTVVVRARPEHQGKSWTWSGHTTMQARYTIRVPAEVSVELATGGGEIMATEVSGSCKAETSGGNLTFTRVRGPLRASTCGGHIALESCDGAINLNTSGGKIEAVAGSGTLDASSAGGSIVVRNFGGDTKVETGGGALSLENVHGRLVGETSGGSISATVPAPLAGDIKLETNAEANEGSVTSEIPMVMERAGRDGLKGTINGGGKSLVLRSGAGNIVIRSTTPMR